MSADHYVFMIESFHKSEMFKNIRFLSTLDFTAPFNYPKIEQLAKSFNCLVLSKDQILMLEGTNVDQIGLLKEGQLYIEKGVKLESANYWPKGINEWESR